MTQGLGPWVLVACLVLFASPLLQGVVEGRGFNGGAVLAALALAGVGIAVYLRVVSKARRDDNG